MPIDMQALARTGAEARLTQLRAEIAEIERAFPGIGGARRERKPASAKAAAEAPKPKRRRSKMSAAQRKAVGERMRKYWEQRRKAKGAKKAS